jgi:nucleotide-binding universal stress UspA family protein
MMRVLVAIDDTLVSLRAAREAARLFSSAEFLVINVTRRQVPWVAGWEYGAAYSVEMSDLPAEGLHDDELGAFVTEAGLAVAEILTVENGDPARAICEAAEAHDVDVIVVGSHDKGVLRRLFDPSVSDAVVHGTYRPVLVVGGIPPTAST